MDANLPLHKQYKLVKENSRIKAMSYKNILPAAYRQSSWDKNESYLPVIYYLANFSRWKPRWAFTGPVLKSVSLALRQRHQCEKQRRNKPAWFRKNQEITPCGNPEDALTFPWVNPLQWYNSSTAIAPQGLPGFTAVAVAAAVSAQYNKSFRKELFFTIATCMTLTEKKHFTKLGSIITERLTLPFPSSDHFFTLICPPIWNSKHVFAPQAFFMLIWAKRMLFLLLFCHLRIPPVSPF